MSSARDASAIEIEKLTHDYPSQRHKALRRALDSVSLTVRDGEIFGLLGPNGSGKSTLFRILTGLLKPTSGAARIFEADVVREIVHIRSLMGVTFQHPSLDKKLTVRENLLHQGHLYGLRGEKLRDGINDSLSRLGIADRAHDLVEVLSGGLQRRAELAKGLLHRPRLLLLDEPSTGLDPGARREFGAYLQSLRDHHSLTVFLTTHILDEAERCDRIAILDRGHVVALGTPLQLKQEIGGDVISVTSKEPEALSDLTRQRFDTQSFVVDGLVRIERPNGHEFIPQLIEAFPGQIDSVTVSKPTLEDVFIHKTGRRFWDPETSDNSEK